jgi:hypothetical protein
MFTRVVTAAWLALGISVVPPQGAALAGASSAVPLSQVDEGLRTETTSVFVVDPAAEVIRVTVTSTVTNELSDPRLYFYRYSVPVLIEAINLVAVRGDGTPLSVGVEQTNTAFVKVAHVDLRPNLFSGQSQTFELTYELPNQPPRSDGLSRVNDAFVSLPAFASGDPGLTSLEVRVPDRYDVEVVGPALARRSEGDEIVLTADAIDDPALFTTTVVATDDDRLRRRTDELGGADVEVLSWPDDPEWADFVAQHLDVGVPTMTELIGQPWPVTDQLDVIETAAPYAYGYAGWYDSHQNAISVGDELNPVVILHELAHVWFNQELFDSRWINEGFAEEYATRTLAEMGQPQDDAGGVDRAAPAAVALNQWDNPAVVDEDSAAVEEYGYAASRHVVHQLVEEVGIEEMRQVIAGAAADDISYTGDDDPELAQGQAWQRFLDLLENLAGSRRATELFDAYVVSDQERELLPERSEARTSYAALEERGGEWAPPLQVRQDMAGWRFELAEAAMAEADEVLGWRDDIEAVVDGLDVGTPALEESYESAQDVADVLASAEETLEAAEAYRDAEARLDAGSGLLGTVGLWWADTGGQLDEARQELEHGDPTASVAASLGLQRRLDNATRDGALRVGAGAGLALTGGIGVPRALRWHRRRRQSSAQPPEPHQGLGWTLVHEASLPPAEPPPPASPGEPQPPRPGSHPKSPPYSDTLPE